MFYRIHSIKPQTICWSFIATLSLAIFCQAKAVTGEELLSYCKPVLTGNDKGLQAGLCLGYIKGVVESPAQSLKYVHELDGQTPQVKDAIRTVYQAQSQQYCLPEGVTNKQLVQEVVNYLNRSPARLQENATVLTLDAYSNVFVCPIQ